MSKMLTIMTCCAALAVLAAGCGGGGSSKTSTTSSGAPASTSGGGGSTAGGGVEIKMQNIQFNPGSATVKVGQKVTWVNEDSVAHNVTSSSGETIKSANFGQGQSFSFTPTKAGTIKYSCTIHPGMNGTLVVR
jgi:plastocyanin